MSDLALFYVTLAEDESVVATDDEATMCVQPAGMDARRPGQAAGDRQRDGAIRLAAFAT